MYTEEQKKAIIEMAKMVLVKDIAPGVTCEGCGAKLPTHADAMNVTHVMQVGVPGHPAIPAFQCPMTEHWACSIECWTKIAHDCVDNHMIPLLQHAHERLNRQNPIPIKPKDKTNG